MSVLKFKSFEEAERALWHFNPDQEYYEKIGELWDFADGLAPIRYPQGIFKFHSIEEANDHRNQVELDYGRKSVTIPARFKKYFWDCDFNNLSLQEYEFFICERILNFGNMDSVKWLLSVMDQARLKDVVEKSRNLNKKTRNYWRTVIDE